jgi:transposase InsO family protein
LREEGFDMEESLRERIALFRYGVISELVGTTLAPGEKEKLLLSAAAKEWTIPGSRRRRIGRSTVRDWVAMYEAMGFEGLKPQPRSDAGSSRSIPVPVQELLLALRAERPRASVHSLIRAVRLSGQVAAEVALAPSTVYRLFAAHGLPASPSPAAEPDAQAFTYPHSGDLWTADVMHGPRLLVPGRSDGAKTYLYALLDDASRMVAWAAFYGAENAACLQDALKQALLRRGVPRRLYCDNGPAFRTHHLEVVCATLNIALVHSRPHQPRGRGKIERFFRHVRSAFLPHLCADQLTDLGALNRIFWAWLEGEYHQTPHGGLDGQTPWERFLADRELLRPAPEDLEALMRSKVLRTVGRDRTVRLERRLYETPDGWAGQTVEVLYDPYDPRRPVHFRGRGETIEHRLRCLDLETNATLKRLPRDVAPTPPVPATGIRYLDLLAKKFYGEEEPQ